VKHGESTTKDGRRWRRRWLICVSALAAGALCAGLAGSQARAKPPVLTEYPDPSGSFATYEPGGPAAPDNPFFHPLGRNGRACVTCHQPADGWTITPAHIEQRFKSSHGQDPLFRLVDGATCPNADVSTPKAMRRAYGLLLSKGLIRMPIPIPPNAEFSVVKVDDPYGCTKLSNPKRGVLSVYRRPLPATNLRFESEIMWDGREPSLKSQAADAAIGHEQAASPPPAKPLEAVVAFERGLWTAQVSDHQAGSLRDAGAGGGPIDLSRQDFYLGINDSLGNDPLRRPFTLEVFNIYQPWLKLGGSPLAERRAAIARGEEIFNQRAFFMGGLAGLLGRGRDQMTTGFCTTCHDTPNAGNRSLAGTIDIGSADASRRTPDLPLFTLRCDSGEFKGQTFQTDDPGRALITGKCADIGAFKVPVLRALAARPPYFHDGSAATLMDVVNFYDLRFGMGLTRQEKDDLVAFLRTL
jgi:cytochrome c peroxidase